MAIEIDNDNDEIRIDGYEYAASKVNVKTYSISSEVSQAGNSADLRITDGDGYIDSVTFSGGSNVSIVRTNGNTITISSGDVDTNTTYSISAETSLTPNSARLRLSGSDGYTDDVVFVGGTSMQIVRTDASTLTVNSLQNSFSSFTDGYSTAVADQTSDTFGIISGPGINATINASNDSLTISNTGVRSFNGAAGDISFNAFGAITDGYNTAIAGWPMDTLNVAGGAGISVLVDGYTDSLTISNTGVRQFNGAAGNISYNSFGTITDGYNTAVADAGNDTVTFVAGTGIGVLVNVPGDSLTISNTGVTQAVAGTGISVSAGTGSVTIGNTGVTSLNSGTGAQYTYSTFTDGTTPTTAGPGNTTMTLAGSNGIKVTTSPNTATISMSQVSIVRGVDATIGFGATTSVLTTNVLPINTTVEIQGVILLAFSNAAAANTYTVSLTTGSGTIGANTSKVALGFAAHASPTAGSPGETTKQVPSFTYPQQIVNTNDHTLRFSGLFQTDGTTPNSLVINIRNNCLNAGENLVVYAKSFLKYNVI